MRRELWQMLSELWGGAVDVAGKTDGGEVRTLALDLPVEFSLVPVDDGWVLRADLPQWRWTTVFDREPGRLTVEIGFLEGYDA